MEKDFRIPLEDIHKHKNTWFKGLFHDQPDEVVYFPYAQHYLSDRPGYYSAITGEEELVEKYQTLDLDNIPDYSAKSHRRMIKYGIIINIIFVTVLLLIIARLL